MADPISVASGLLALVVFALESGKTLYQVVQSFQSSQRIVRELRQELEALDGVLESLRDAATTSDADFAALELPLLRCGKACSEFQAVIVKCTAHSGGARTSFRDWAKLKYMGDDIDGFKNMLAGYKSTITIALGDANIRKATVTINLLNEYKEMIHNTTSDLEEHLQGIDNKLQSLSLQSAKTSGEDEAERQRIQEERESTQQCLSICAQVSTHIDRVQLNASENISITSGPHQVFTTNLGNFVPARRLTGNALKECKKGLINTTSQLEKQLQDINNRLQNLSQRDGASNERATEQARIEEEMDSIKQCLNICARAAEQAAQNRINVFEDVALTDDGHQVIVATLGDLISAKHVMAGARSTQWLGQMSDTSLQHLSQNHGRRTMEKDTEPKTEIDTQFKGRYGAGHKLNFGSLKDQRAASE